MNFHNNKYSCFALKRTYTLLSIVYCRSISQINITIDCETHFYDRSGEIFSPAYPRNYSDNIRCRYVIHGNPNSTITLNFDVFSLEYERECKYDRLEVGNIISARIISITYKVNVQLSLIGAKYLCSTTAVLGTGLVVLITITSGDADCIVLHYLSLFQIVRDMEGDENTTHILCGSELPRLSSIQLSHQGLLTLNFISDRSQTSSGFYLNYYVNDNTDKGKTPLLVVSASMYTYVQYIDTSIYMFTFFSR